MHIQVHIELKLWLGVWYGCQESMQIWRQKLSNVQPVKLTGSHLQKHHCTLGSGHPSLHVDFTGPFLGRTALILVDAHSKWLEVIQVSTPSSQQAIKAPRHIFSTHGLPEVLVSDNGSAFTSMDFATFVKSRHIRCAPYHPANGQAERVVQTFKEAMKKMVTGRDLDTHLSRFLFQYRLIPHLTTGHFPAELMFGCKPRSHLDFLFLDVGL